MELSAEAAEPACGCHTGCATAKPRAASVQRALRLEYFTVGWNVVECVVAVTAALLAGSVAILGFGIDSAVECASAVVMIWRLGAERSQTRSDAQLDAIEHRARRLIAGTLFALAAYVSFDAVHMLWVQDKPSFSPVGVALLILSLVVMRWLARAKQTLARELGSAALQADAMQTTACWWLSIAALLGVGLHGALGWWWADPAAALVIAALITREAREAWHGKACC